MAWDDVKATGNQITADEWNNHVTDQKRRGFDSVQVFETDGTFDATDIDSVFVEAVGGGGGGGGLTSSSNGTASGGGGGGYAASFIDVSADTNVAVTVGSGGSGGTPSGGAGGDSTFKSLTANGASGGIEPSGSTVDGGSGGGGTGDIVIPGGDGGGGIVINSSNYTDGIPFAKTGSGGDSRLGSGANGLPDTSGLGRVGVPGNIYGGGGCGASDLEEVLEPSGGDGADGVVIVYFTN